MTISPESFRKHRGLSALLKSIGLVGGMVLAEEAFADTKTLPSNSHTEISMPGSYAEAPSPEQVVYLINQIQNIAIQLGAEIKDTKPLTRVGVAPIVPKEAVKDGYDYFSKNPEFLNKVVNNLCEQVHWPKDVAALIKDIIINPELRSQYLIRNQSMLIGQAGLTMPSLSSAKELKFTGPYKWQGKDAMFGDYLVIPHQGSFYVLFIPTYNDTYQTGSMPACYNMSPLGAFTTKSTTAPTPTPCPEKTPEVIYVQVTPEARPEKEPNWELNLGLDNGLEKNELEQRYHVILDVDTDNSPDANGNYWVELDCNITTTEGYKNPAGFSVSWETPQGQRMGDRIALTLPYGVHNFIAIVTDSEGRQTPFPITCSVPGDNTVSSDALHESEEYSSKQTFRFAVTRSFESGVRFGTDISGVAAGLSLGFGKNGKHLFGSLDVGGIYNYNLKEVMAQIRAQAGVTLFEKLGLGVNGESTQGQNVQHSKLSGILRYQPTKNWQFRVNGGIEQIKTKEQGKTQNPYYSVGISHKF